MEIIVFGEVGVGLSTNTTKILFISKRRNVMFIEIGTLDVDISKSINGGVGNETIRNGS